jgi:integrase
MINNLPKNRPTIFQPKKHALRSYLCTQRKALAQKLNNPRLTQISFHTLRHWKGTMEYHKTKDIIHVKTILGHKAITSTMIYINIESAIFLTQSDEWTCKIANDTKDATTLIETGFEYITGEYDDGGKLFRKRK